ncbi:hypothetical protein EVAR_51606_1 [Eumeta japonica]|uniref:Uncharacterized protein n=1 Tax=Eumeta variegata TaxID=151549 RepID=A0A4C1YED9_EUMVA|nr:hypothetical protein EVAR_51606_1 [Eumeta japonica]
MSLKFHISFEYEGNTRVPVGLPPRPIRERVFLVIVMSKTVLLRLMPFGDGITSKVEIKITSGRLFYQGRTEDGTEIEIDVESGTVH